jgi:transcriptional regulator with XRE-family HTH domain
MIAVTREDARGRLVAAARILAGLDQNDLGALAGVSGSTISNLENGHKTMRSTLVAVDRALKGKGVNFSFGEDMIVIGVAFADKNAATVAGSTL